MRTLFRLTIQCAVVSCCVCVHSFQTNNPEQMSCRVHVYPFIPRAEFLSVQRIYVYSIQEANLLILPEMRTKTSGRSALVRPSELLLNSGFFFVPPHSRFSRTLKRTSLIVSALAPKWAAAVTGAAACRCSRSDVAGVCFWGRSERGER